MLGDVIIEVATAIVRADPFRIVTESILLKCLISIFCVGP